MESPQTTQKDPFGPIALSLSGGGYRAAAFHLGSMSYLERLSLLKEVTMLSTVSGGTFTGVQYSLSLMAGIPFEDFFRDFYELIRDTHLLKLALAKIGRKAPDTLSDRQDLITAFAQVYEEEFFPNKRFGIFWNGPEIHLKELIFNATEFKTGIGFRFQKSQNPQAKIGNGNVWISEEEAKDIRIADIVAASSCFPGGFEPLAFPDDFQWDSLPASLKEKFPEPLPLMDGGIYDNQGIESLLLAEERTQPARPDLGLLIISDTHQPQDFMFKIPKKKKSGWLKLRHVRYLSWIIFALAVVSFVMVLKQTIDMFREESFNLYRFIFLDLIPLLLSGGVAIALIWIRSKIFDFLDLIPNIKLKAWKDLRRLTVNELVYLLKLRIKSLLSLTSDIFMKRIRDLIFGLVYRDEDYSGKRISNLIYDLTPQKKPDSRMGAFEPSRQMTKTAENATKMDTQLWFDDEQQLKDLVACGQFTMGYNILEYIIRRFGEDPSQYSSDVKEVFDKAQTDWEAFRENPYAFLP